MAAWWRGVGMVLLCSPQGHEEQGGGVVLTWWRADVVLAWCHCAHHRGTRSRT